MDGPRDLSGTGLHSGRPCRVTVERHPGPVTLRGSRGRATLKELSVLRTDRGVRVASHGAGIDVDGVEHFLAALGGLGLHEGLAFAVEGGELPLADGGALAFARLLSGLRVPPSAPALRVVRRGEITLETSRYLFEPADGVALEVCVDFPGLGPQQAAWDGTAEAFIADIAWARTFGFAKDAELLFSSGRARGVDPRSVMVLDERGRVQPPGAPERPGELARHKLLDLVGDLYLGGGPPLGRVSAIRPGHGATRRALGLAASEGIIAPSRPGQPW